MLRTILHFKYKFAPVHIFAKEIEDHRALFYYFRLDFFIEIGQVFHLAFALERGVDKVDCHLLFTEYGFKSLVEHDVHILFHKSIVLVVYYLITGNGTNVGNILFIPNGERDYLTQM